MKIARRTRKIQESALKTNRIGCGCALFLLSALMVTMLIAAYLAASR